MSFIDPTSPSGFLLWSNSSNETGIGWDRWTGRYGNPLNPNSAFYCSPNYKPFITLDSVQLRSGSGYESIYIHHPEIAMQRSVYMNLSQTFNMSKGKMEVNIYNGTNTLTDVQKAIIDSGNSDMASITTKSLTIFGSIISRNLTIATANYTCTNPANTILNIKQETLTIIDGSAPTSNINLTQSIFENILYGSLWIDLRGNFTNSMYSQKGGSSLILDTVTYANGLNLFSTLAPTHYNNFTGWKFNILSLSTPTFHQSRSWNHNYYGKNSEFIETYEYISAVGNAVNDTIYYENITFTTNGRTDYLYGEIRYVFNDGGQLCWNNTIITYDMKNVLSDRADKRVNVTAVVLNPNNICDTNVTFNFHANLEIKVQNENGTGINNANITITGLDETEYDTTLTNINGGTVLDIDYYDWHLNKSASSTFYMTNLNTTRHQLTITATGYKTYNSTVDFNGASEWTISLLEDSPSFVLDKIATIHNFTDDEITYNISLKLINKGGIDSLNTTLTDSDSESSPYDLGTLSSNSSTIQSYLENYSRNSTTYSINLSIANVTGQDEYSNNFSENSSDLTIIIPASTTSQQLTLIKNAYYNSENSTHVNYTLTIQVVNSGGEDLTSISVLDTDLDLSTSINLNRTQNYSYSNYTLVEKAASNTNKLFVKSSATVNTIVYQSNQLQVRIPGYGGPADAIVYAPASVTSSTSFDTTITVENQNADIGQDFTIDYWITNELETANYSSGQQTIYVPYSGTSNLTATLTSPSSDGNYRLKALVTWVGGTATAYDTFVVSTPVAEEVQGHQGGGGGTGRAIQEVICNPPYMRYGIECCLDANNNSICDSDEEETSEIISEGEEEGAEETTGGKEEGIFSNIFSSFSDYVKENKKYIFAILEFLVVLLLLSIVIIKILQNKRKNKKIKELEEHIQKINFSGEGRKITDTGYREERRLVALAGISALIISFGFLLKPNFTGGVLGIPEINSLQTGLTIIICIFGALFLTGISLLLLKRFRPKNIYLPGRVGGLIHKKVYSENGYYIGEIKKIILKGNIIDFFQIKLDKRLKFKKKGIMLSYKYVKDIGHVVIVKKEISKHLNFK